MTADVTVCIPAYRAAGFVSKAIESVLAQSYQNIKVLISIEPADDGTETVCRRYETDPRVTIKVNAERLGWVGNVNSCLDLVDTPYGCFCFHDDWHEPDFVKDTRQALIDDPSAVAAFCHIQQMGDKSDVRHFDEYLGTGYERALAFLTGNSATYTLKSMMRADVFRAGLRMPEIGPQGYQADWPFMVALSLQGRGRVVDRVLYRKNYSDETTTANWRKMPVGVRSSWEIQARTAVLNVIATSNIQPNEKLVLAKIVLGQLLRDWDNMAFSKTSLDDYDLNAAALMALAQYGVRMSPDEMLDDPDKVNEFLAHQLARRAGRHVRQPDPQGASVFAKQALGKNPNDAKAQIAMALAHVGLAKTTPAQHLRRGFKLAKAASDADPTNSRAWWAMAQVAKKQGRPKAALRFARRALETATVETNHIKCLIKSLENAQG